MIIGNENIKKQIEVSVNAANIRNMAVPHMLFSGAAGCGKTTLARHVAEITNTPFLSVVPDELKDYESVIFILDRLNHENYDERGNRAGRIKPTILFLDEIHNLPLKGQELLGLVMERFMIESIKPDKYFWVPFFTLIGATTLSGKLSKPFRDRFKITFNFEPYILSEMESIVGYHAARLRVRITSSAVLEIAKRSRGTPRIAVGFVERVRDKMLSTNSVVVTAPIVQSTFEELGIDEEGLSTLELRILNILFETGMPVGLDNLSIILQEDSKSIRDFAEPYLIRKGFIIVSGKGRIITEKGVQYLKVTDKISRFIKKEIDFNYERA
jgi:Holliday junction DNA helicase RuvB